MSEIVKPYGPWMKATPKRQPYLTGSRWLRSGSLSQTPVLDSNLARKEADMDAGEGEKLGVVNQDPKSKESEPMKEGMRTGNQETEVTEEGILEDNIISNNVIRANRMDEDSKYVFTDPKRRRPNENITTNPNSENSGLPKNLQVAGLQGGVCQDQ